MVVQAMMMNRKKQVTNNSEWFERILTEPRRQQKSLNSFTVKIQMLPNSTVFARVKEKAYFQSQFSSYKQPKSGRAEKIPENGKNNNKNPQTTKQTNKQTNKEKKTKIKCNKLKQKREKTKEKKKRSVAKYNVKIIS